MSKHFTKGKIAIYIILFTIITIGILFIMPGHTDKITDKDGKTIPGSIATMEKIKIGGVDQWVVIRGTNKKNPILLMLSGGPGASEMGLFLKYNKHLEDDFIVVIWEQRGCGKSYPAIKDKKGLKVEQYVSDINELTNYLKDRFNREKIYLLGHSWGTIIGTMAVKKYPEQFHAYIGAAQMVNVLETDKYMYQYVLSAAEKAGEEDLVKKLKEAGEPPYYDEKMLHKYRLFLSRYAQYYKKENPFEEKNTEWNNISRMVLFDEYSLVDKIRYFRGFMDTFPIVYPQLQDLDFVTQANDLEVPVYYMIGRHDYTAKFIKEYFNVLKVPSKQLYWFEHSGHGEIYTEPKKFHNLMVNEVLAAR